MADFVFNIAKGRVAQLAKNVDDGSPANSRLVVLVYNTSATDATLKDLTTIAAVEADANTAEVANSGYARKVLTGANVTVTFDNATDTAKVDIDDQTWTAVAAGTAWTDLCIAYDDDSTTGTDSNLIPLTWHDFAVTPDGSDITAQIAAGGFFTAA